MHVEFDSDPQDRSYIPEGGTERKWRIQTGAIFFPGKRIPLMFEATLEDGQKPYKIDGTKYTLARDHFRVVNNKLTLNARTPFVEVGGAGK